MRLLRGICLSLMLAGTASANPNGAPWGAAKPGSGQDCTSCHFDGDAVLESDRIQLTLFDNGLTAIPGETYVVLLLFHNDGPMAGFQISASAGEFIQRKDDIECRGAEARSAKPAKEEDGSVLWRLVWRAPESEENDVIFNVAVNAANDDASPFGDQVHFADFLVDLVPAGQ